MLSFLYAGLRLTVFPSFFNGGDTSVNLKTTLAYASVFIPSAVALTWAFEVKKLLASILISTEISILYSHIAWSQM
ncbi:hypothetical protein KEJ27_04220 [Candidatus Bathyarchaeota archaeon]|nr:hypothetical protein [Candidatus Bathyarchaeota archaeon]MBS7613195.1 hypothetical protein [Candidatus Bathyarchaeota archaeon]MBS7617131.1 hypothetical protein [Candidatus Bathyarchaeota archaeon]